MEVEDGFKVIKNNRLHSRAEEWKGWEGRACWAEGTALAKAWQYAPLNRV